MSFIVKTAVENAIVKEKKVAQPRKTILERSCLKILENLDKSISDAKGRYEDFKASKDAERKPSLNWQVVKPAQRVERDGKMIWREEDLLNEEVKVWLNVGLSKLAIGEKGEQFITVPASILIAVLEDMRDMVEKARNADGTPASETLWNMAIERAFPPGRPAEEKEGMNYWTYSMKDDQWVETFNADVAKADEIEDEEERKAALQEIRKQLIAEAKAL